MFRSGSRLGKYRLEKKLGRGAFSEVWKARDTVEGRRIALKIVPPATAEAYGREDVEREAQIVVRLSHPNIVAVRNADWIDGYFVMSTELAKTNLADYRGVRRSPAVALRVIRDVAAGLAYAHRLGLLHRDVKPENILIFDDGRAALSDFGLSRFASGMSQTFTEVGTLGYMAPEQAYAKPAFASDVFSFGLIAYETITGRRPSWPFDWPPERIDTFNRNVPAPVRPVLRKAAEIKQNRRYVDGVALHRALERAFNKAKPKKSTDAARKLRRKKTNQSPLVVQAELFRRRHGARLEMKYRCHRCDGPIAESMVACPWCGTKENSFREVTAYPVVCPDCERGVRAEWTACPWCYGGRFEGNGRKPRPDPKATRDCSRPGCDGELRPFMRYCPSCKQKTRRIWTDTELPDRCPRCRWSVSRTFWHFCPWCARREPKAGGFVRSKS